MFLSKNKTEDPMENIIIDLFNIDKSLVQEFTAYRDKNEFHVFVTFKKKDYFCDCGEVKPMRFKEYYSKTLTHNLLMDSKTIIHYRARRYQCDFCRKTIYETNPFSAPYQKKTHNILMSIINKLMKPEMTFTSVAQELHLSSTSVINIFDLISNTERQELPEVLCLDELYFSRYASYKYCCVLVDFQTNKLVDIIESRKKYYLTNYFDTISEFERNKVKFVCIDFYEPYRQVIKRKFKNAQICIDKFHIIQLVNRSLDQVRLKVMRNFNKTSTQYYLLKNFEFLLFKSQYYEVDGPKKFNRKLNGYYNYYRLLSEILKIDNDLKAAFNLRKNVQWFLEIQSDNREIIETKFYQLISEIKKENINEMRSFANTLVNWSEEILNSFYWVNNRRISNGPIESVNGTLKKIKNNANGFINFSRFRARAFLVVNKIYSLNVSNTTNMIRMKNLLGDHTKRLRDNRHL